MHTTTHAAAQALGARTFQCDATAHHDDPGTGHQAWVLLDGIGDRRHVSEWVPGIARDLAVLAARLGDAHAAIEQIRPLLHSERATRSYPKGQYPDAAAIVALHSPGGAASIAWAGDCRAYLADGTRARLLTTDHNAAADQRASGHEPDPRAHDRLTSSLCYLPGRIDAITLHFVRPTRLLLASDGAYLPHENAGTLPAAPVGQARKGLAVGSPRILAPVLTGGSPERAAHRIADLAVRSAASRTDDPGRVDNATAMVIDLHP
ncbi:PP2C family protein-serine/threonine phosphatase [Kitasatospora sp. NPDC001119]